MTSETAQVLFFACANKKKRYFLPTKENYFGRVKIEYMMVDSGCNSFLLPLKENQIEELVSKFKPDNSTWSISMGGSNGVAAVKNITLTIHQKPLRIDVKLCLNKTEDKLDMYETEVDFLRFHLCYKDVTDIKNYYDKKEIKLDEESYKRLGQYLSVVTNINSVNSLSKRRKHGLIGQTFLNDPNIMCIQSQDVYIVMKTPRNDKQWASLNKIIREYIARSEILVHKSFESNEFDDLENEDHDAEDSIGFEIIMRDKDFIDEVDFLKFHVLIEYFKKRYLM
jgi:hypothetical protein